MQRAPLDRAGGESLFEEEVGDFGAETLVSESGLRRSLGVSVGVWEGGKRPELWPEQRE